MESIRFYREIWNKFKGELISLSALQRNLINRLVNLYAKIIRGKIKRNFILFLMN